MINEVTYFMGTTISTIRVLIVAGLAASLGFAGICPCKSDGAVTNSSGQASHASHACPCTLSTGHCCCGSHCQCGQQAPQKDNEPAVPSRSNDRSQTLAVIVPIAAFIGTTVTACQAECCPALLRGDNSSLVAQGTRLNC